MLPGNPGVPGRRTLLVHVDDGPRCASRVAVAAALAKTDGSRLVGVYLVPGRNFSPWMAAVVPEAALREAMSAAAAMQAAAEAAFRDAASTLAPAQVGWHAPAGDPLDAALAHAKACDLFVLGQPDPDDPDAPLQAPLLTAILLGAGRPILVVPYAGARATPGRRIAVATDGGPEATRAMGDAMFLLERAAEVVVLIGAVPGGSSNTIAAARISEWLGHHGVAARVETDVNVGGDPGERLMSRVADLGSDLVVMGGYGHSRLREAVLGGVTRTVLREMATPVLMSH
jgi:nucleotide-binding universal stress UspA family protein